VAKKTTKRNYFSSQITARLTKYFWAWSS